VLRDDQFSTDGPLALSVLMTASVLWISGCATQGKSIALGSAIGAGTGAAIGGIADPGKDGEYRTRNVIIGAGVGAVVGGVGGGLIHSGQSSAREEGQKEGSKTTESYSGAMPNLKDPRVEVRWVEGRIIGNRYVDGHFEYLIAEPAKWER